MSSLYVYYTKCTVKVGSEDPVIQSSTDFDIKNEFITPKFRNPFNLEAFFFLQFTKHGCTAIIHKCLI